MKIIIDSGHGGSDPGAIAFGSLEKDLNLNFSEKLAETLATKGYEVDSSLINDENYDSQVLTSLIRASQANLCISCHNNTANGSVRGFEVIHSIHSDGVLAKEIISAVEKTGYIVRSAYSRESYIYPDTDYFFIIRETYPDVETIIVELGFMDNSEDFALLTSNQWQMTLTNAVADAVSSYLPLPLISKTPILGTSEVSAFKLKSAVTDNNPDFNNSIVDEYIEISSLYGIRGDLAFCQCINETNWFLFTGNVKREQNNFAGLGATGNGVTGATFASISEGVEAHIQHLYAYATTNDLPQDRTLVDPRFNYVRRGIAPNIEDLDGKWAVPGIGYGERIVTLLDLINEKYADPVVVDPKDPDTTEEHWAKACNDELIEAGILFDDHSSTLDQPASEGMVICIANRLRKELLKNE